MNFLFISRPNVNPPPLFLTAHTTTTRLPTTPPPGSTEVTTTGWFKHESTTVFLSAPTSQTFSSNEPQTVAATTGFPLNNVTSTSSRLSTSGEQSCLNSYMIFMPHEPRVTKYLSISISDETSNSRSLYAAIDVL